LALAALALVVFGAYDSYPIKQNAAQKLPLRQFTHLLRFLEGLFSNKGVPNRKIASYRCLSNTMLR